MKGMKVPINAETGQVGSVQEQLSSPETRREDAVGNLWGDGQFPLLAAPFPQ